MRKLPEWIAKRDDDAIPPRVKDRIAADAEGRCKTCTRPITGKLRAEFDHMIPLIIGGSHRENNIQLLCHECHAAKTKLDVKLKAKVARVRKHHLGIKSKSSRPFPGSRASGLKKLMSGGVVRRAAPVSLDDETDDQLQADVSRVKNKNAWLSDRDREVIERAGTALAEKDA
jgi:5-methylcytosine-specific restriction protein A